jgi:hypothetical protein
MLHWDGRSIAEAPNVTRTRRRGARAEDLAADKPVACDKTAAVKAVPPRGH